MLALNPALRPSLAPAFKTRVFAGTEIVDQFARWESRVGGSGHVPLSRHPAWLRVLEQSLQHRAYCLEATDDGESWGVLPLVFVRSILFGRYLVSLPYLNYGGVIGDRAAAPALISRAQDLADELNVRFLELRHEEPLDYPGLVQRSADKVHMRVDLPASPGELWDRLSPKVRNLVRKGQRNSVTISWGTHDVLHEFYRVFAQNMRDLGTPVFGRHLFDEILSQFRDRAELCVARIGTQPIAAALLLHGWDVTEVPSASSLRTFNHTSANMLMYWSLLERAVQRGQKVFDFGRSTVDGPTFRFKKQWGASPFPAAWQYYVREGDASAMRPDNPRFQRLIHIWQRMPVWVTRCLGPRIVRGIP